MKFNEIISRFHFEKVLDKKSIFNPSTKKIRNFYLYIISNYKRQYNQIFVCTLAPTR